MLKKLEDYINSRLLLLKVEAAEKISDSVSILFKRIAIFTIAGIFFFFASLAAAIWLGEICNSYATGFLIIAGIYLVVLIILIVFKKQLLEKNIKNEIISSIFQDSNK